LKTKCSNLAIFFPSLLAIENFQNQLILKILIALSDEIFQNIRKTQKLVFTYKKKPCDHDALLALIVLYLNAVQLHILKPSTKPSNIFSQFAEAGERHSKDYTYC
jgi:hypothetical protein